jgi:hypothetical protein
MPRARSAHRHSNGSPCMTAFRFAAAALAAWLVVGPAVADEHATYQNLEVSAPGAPDCRVGMLMSLPPSWRTDDGAVVLVTTGQPSVDERDRLVSALLAEHAAVLELLPLRCAAPPGGPGRVATSAIGALDAMTRAAGAGLVVAIGYGPGSAAVLEVVGEPAAGLLGAAGPRYAAAVALGDGEPAFARGAPQPASQQAPARLGLLCRALAALAAGMDATPRRAAPSYREAASCHDALAGDAPPAAPRR